MEPYKSSIEKLTLFGTNNFTGYANLLQQWTYWPGDVLDH